MNANQTVTPVSCEILGSSIALMLTVALRWLEACIWQAVVLPCVMSTRLVLTLPHKTHAHCADPRLVPTLSCCRQQPAKGTAQLLLTATWLHDVDATLLSW
jgi:hypothetical protein